MHLSSELVMNPKFLHLTRKDRVHDAYCCVLRRLTFSGERTASSTSYSRPTFRGTENQNQPLQLPRSNRNFVQRRKLVGNNRALHVRVLVSMDTLLMSSSHQLNRELTVTNI